MTANDMKSILPSEALRFYANSIAQPVLECNIYYPEIAEYAFSCIKYKREEYRIAIYAAQSLFNIEVKGINTNIYFSVNRENKSHLYDKLLPPVINKSKYRIYVDSLPPRDEVRCWLENRNHIDLIDACSLSDRGSLQIYTDGINLFLESIGDFDAVLERTFALAKTLPSSINTFDFSSLPPKFKPLLPQIKKWGLGDDVERAEKLQKTPRLTKKRLVKLVTPYMNEINEYLSSFGDTALSDDAILLGRLAETVSEISIDMN